MKRLVFSLLFISSLSFAAGEDCSRRLEADVFYSAFVSGMHSGALSVKELAFASSSELPVNPLLHSTPTAKSSSAKTLFTYLSQDAGVRERWPITRQRLGQLLAEKGGEDLRRRKAGYQTELILNPQRLKDFDVYPKSLSFTSFGNDALMAYVDGQGYLKAFRISDGEELLSLKTEGFTYWLTAWNKEPDGRLSLYLLTRENFGNYDIKIFRTNLIEKRLEPFTVEPKISYRVSPMRLIGLSPDVLVIESVANPPHEKFKYINIAHHRQSDITPWLSQSVLTPTLPPEGGPMQNPKETFGRAFVTASGRAFKISGPLGKLVVSERGGDTREFYLENNGRPEDIALTETVDGKILFAVLQPHKVSHGVLSVFDFERGSRPYIQQDLDWYALEGLHFFRDRQKNSLLAVPMMQQGKCKLRFIDARDGAALGELPIPGPIDNWASAGDQTYFWISADERAFLYRLFTKP